MLKRWRIPRKVISRKETAQNLPNPLSLADLAELSSHVTSTGLPGREIHRAAPLFDLLNQRSTEWFSTTSIRYASVLEGGRSDGLPDLYRSVCNQNGPQASPELFNRAHRDDCGAFWGPDIAVFAARDNIVAH